MPQPSPHFEGSVHAAIAVVPDPPNLRRGHFVVLCCGHFVAPRSPAVRDADGMSNFLAIDSTAAHRESCLSIASVANRTPRSRNSFEYGPICSSFSFRCLRETRGGSLGGLEDLDRRGQRRGKNVTFVDGKSKLSDVVETPAEHAGIIQDRAVM